jgi:hypothetical protein
MKIKGSTFFLFGLYESTQKLGYSMSMTLSELVVHLLGKSGAYQALILIIVTNTKIRLEIQYSILVLGTQIFITNTNVLQEQATMFHSGKNFKPSLIFGVEAAGLSLNLNTVGALLGLAPAFL